MNMGGNVDSGTAARDAAGQIEKAARARKCWSCGCLHSTLAALRVSAQGRLPELARAVIEASERLVPVRYDCLGCEECYPALAINALEQGPDGAPALVDACRAEFRVQQREGWPALPGEYSVARFHAPVAVCTLTDGPLAERLAGTSGLSIAGTLHTENLGIERLVANVLANPNIRFLIVCGPDGRQSIGHLPGQSLVALARGGVDGRHRIVGAGGKRPVLCNLEGAAIAHFRRTVEVVDMVGQVSVPEIRAAVAACAARDPGPADPYVHARVVAPIVGSVPDRMVPDPAGFFVVYVDRMRGLLVLEHYQCDGVVNEVIEGRVAPELYMTTIQRGLVTRLDHAAYLGQELARAAEALRSGAEYLQDAAAEAGLAERSQPRRPTTPVPCGAAKTAAGSGPCGC